MRAKRLSPERDWQTARGTRHTARTEHHVAGATLFASRIDAPLQIGHVKGKRRALAMACKWVVEGQRFWETLDHKAHARHDLRVGSRCHAGGGR